MRNKRNNGGILREARNEFEAELTSDTLLCFLLTDSGMTTYEISPTIYSPVRKDLEWSLTCNKGPHFATPLPGWDRNASSTDVMGYQDRTRYDGRPHYIIHNPGKGISRSGTFADVGFDLISGLTPVLVVVATPKRYEKLFSQRSGTQGIDLYVHPLCYSMCLEARQRALAV